MSVPLHDLVSITPDLINQESITSYLSDPTSGAISLFIGTTRNHFNGKQVLELRYEAYTAMATKQLYQICSTARSKWDINRMAIIHRTGIVPVGEASVIVGVSATHRHDALLAVGYAIDEVKACATIWKKEVYKDGGGEWKENKECFWEVAAKPV